MELITQEILDKAPPLYANEHVAPEDVPVIAKFFAPVGRMTFFMTEFNPDTRIAFGWMVSPLGPDCDELGYVSIDELEGVELPYGLRIERDLHLGEMTLAEAMAS